MSKMIVGSTVLGGAAYLTAQGHITGGNLMARKLKKNLTGDSRYGEYMFNVPGTDVSFKYDKFDPLGALMKVGADLAEISGYVTDENFHDYEQLVGAAVVLTKDLMIPEGPVGSFGDLVKFISEPSTKNIPLSTTGFIPMGGLVREITKTGTFAFDPARRDLTTGVVRTETIEGKEVETAKLAKGVVAAWDELLNKFLDTLGLGKDMPVLLNSLGDETAYPPGVKPEHSLPFFKHDLDKDNLSPVYKELYRLAPNEFTDAAEPLRDLLPRPARIVNFGSVASVSGVTAQVKGDVFKYELSPKQYHKLSKFSAGIGLGGKTLKETLLKEFGSSSYKKATDLEKKGRIYTIGAKFRKAGMKKMMSEIDDVENTVKRMGEKFKLRIQGR
jgi:hypothetical protein